MKRKRRRSSPAADAAAETFVRGFVVTALLSALQDRPADGAPIAWRRVVRHGLQGGAALTAATIAAEAVARRDLGTGVIAVAAGAVLVSATEAALNPPSIQENTLGQEKA